MTLHYDTEMLRVALEAAERAATALSTYQLPDWMRHRLTHIIGECVSMRDALEAYEIETEGGDK